MKFCEKCGKEIMEEAVVCPNCGCSVKKAKAPEDSYEQAVKGAAITNIIGVIALAVGIICALFVNVWVGAILCLVAELVVLIPNTKFQNLFKSNNTSIVDKKEFKAAAKKTQTELKAKCSAFKFSFVIAYISLACLIIIALLGNAMGL